MQEFYATDSQPIVGPVIMLPQKGSVSGGSKRPLNSFAILRDGYSILFDAPFSWTLDGIAKLADEGHPPRALVISHKDLSASGDAFDTLVERYGLTVLMHPDDQSEGKSPGLSIGLHDPTSGDGAAVLRDADVEVLHVPGHSPGSIMLYLADDGGILLAGDSAVGPGPEQPDRSARLERPIGADEDDRFLDAWQKLAARLPLAAVLPLHGEIYLRTQQGDQAFDAIVANICNGAPMDPRKV